LSPFHDDVLDTKAVNMVFLIFNLPKVGFF
jgi:hypothetical protein